MNTCPACMPMPISLGGSPWRRLSQRLADHVHHVLERLRRAARERAERRRARSYSALYASLDDRTLRDIGLGDWVGDSRWPPP